MGMYVTTASRHAPNMSHLRPILSEIAPKTVKNGIAQSRAMAMMILAVLVFTLRIFYLQTILKVNTKTANIIIAIALLCAMPFFTAFGAISAKIGRKWLMMGACL